MAVDVRNPYGRDRVKLLAPKSIDNVPPPHDINAEHQVIGAAIYDPSLLAEVPWLRAEHFFSGASQIIWRALQSMRAEGTPIDLVTLESKLKAENMLARVGDRDHLRELTEGVPVPLPRVYRAWAGIIEEKARLRELAATADLIRSRCYHEAGVAPEVFADAERRLHEFAQSHTGRRTVRLGTESIFAKLPEEPRWICKGLLLVPGRVAVVGGAPDSGKTLGVQAMALAIAAGRSIWDAFKVERPGLVIHLNWDQELEATYRRYQRIARGYGMWEDDVRGLLEVVDDPGFDFSLDNDVGLVELRAICRGAACVVIDALTGAISDRIDENSPAMGRILRRIGKMSEQTGCLIIILHHASKPAPTFKGKKAERDALHDLRGSGSIGGAAGNVLIQRALKKGEVYGMVQGRIPTFAKRALEPFALKFHDLVNEDGESIDAVRVTYMPPEEVAASMTKKEPEEAKPDRTDVVEQLAVRVLDLIVKHTKSSTGYLEELSPKVHKRRFNAALERLEKTGRIRDALGGKFGDRKPKEWVAL
jgi:hypothetical protein